MYTQLVFKCQYFCIWPWFCFQTTAHLSNVADGLCEKTINKYTGHSTILVVKNLTADEDGVYGIRQLFLQTCHKINKMYLFTILPNTIKIKQLEKKNYKGWQKRSEYKNSAKSKYSKCKT